MWHLTDNRSYAAPSTRNGKKEVSIMILFCLIVCELIRMLQTGKVVGFAW